MIELHLFKDAYGGEVTREEYVEGEVWHREGSPALRVSSGLEAWYRQGKLHREDGPAIHDQASGYKAWFLEGVVQRVEHASGVIFEVTPAHP